jgi:hypothetical protein
MKLSQLKKIIKESIKELQEKELVQTTRDFYGGCVCVYFDPDTEQYSHETTYDECECSMAASQDPNNSGACCASSGLVSVGPLDRGIDRRMHRR